MRSASNLAALAFELAATFVSPEMEYQESRDAQEESYVLDYVLNGLYYDGENSAESFEGFSLAGVIAAPSKFDANFLPERDSREFFYLGF